MVNPTAGQGSAAVTLTVIANAQGRSRSGGVSINDTRVTISQEPAPCRFELGDQSTRVGFEGGRASVRVSTIDGCEWRVSGSTSWMRALTPGGTGSGTVDFDVDRNAGGERSVTLSIAGISFVLVQDGASGGPGGAPGAPGAPSSCNYAIDPDRTTIRSAAGQGSVRIITDAGCPWMGSSSASWISLQQASGTGPDTLTYRVSANLSTVSERSASIVVAAQTHRVTQQACDLNLEAGSPNLPSSAGTFNFRVTTDGGCTWSANSTVEWITVIGSSGTGSGSITYRVADNPTTRDRVGAIVVSGRTKVIVQQALGQN
jgi:hypothetical protein